MRRPFRNGWPFWLLCSLSVAYALRICSGGIYRCDPKRSDGPLDAPATIQRPEERISRLAVPRTASASLPMTKSDSGSRNLTKGTLPEICVEEDVRFGHGNPQHKHGQTAPPSRRHRPFFSSFKVANPALPSSSSSNSRNLSASSLCPIEPTLDLLDRTE